METYWYIVKDYRGDDDGFGMRGPIDVHDDMSFDDVLEICKEDYIKDIFSRNTGSLTHGARIAAIYNSPMWVAGPFHKFEPDDTAAARADEYREYDDYPLEHAERNINFWVGKIEAYLDIYHNEHHQTVYCGKQVYKAIDKLMHETDVATFFYHGSQV